MSIPKNTMDVIDEMADVPADMQAYVAETARDAWDGYIALLAEEAEESHV